MLFDEENYKDAAVPPEEPEVDNMMAWDDVSGEFMDPAAVQEARAQEIRYIRNIWCTERCQSLSAWSAQENNPSQLDGSTSTRATG